MTETTELIVEDGVINRKRWGKPRLKKVLFVLKEPGVDPRKNKPEIVETPSIIELFNAWGRPRYSFKYLGRLAYGIQHADKSPTYDDASEPAAMAKAFLSSAFINLKQTPTTKANKSLDAGFKDYVKNHAQDITKRIDSIEAEAIVFCGAEMRHLVSEYLSEVKESSARIFYTCHPSSFKSKRNAYKTLMASIHTGLSPKRSIIDNHC